MEDKTRIGLCGPASPWGAADHCSPLNWPGADLFFRGVAVLPLEFALTSPVLFFFSPQAIENHPIGITSSNRFWCIKGMFPYGEQTTLILTVKYRSATCAPSPNNLWMEQLHPVEEFVISPVLHIPVTRASLQPDCLSWGSLVVFVQTQLGWDSGGERQFSAQDIFSECSCGRQQEQESSCIARALTAHIPKSALFLAIRFSPSTVFLIWM